MSETFQWKNPGVGKGPMSRGQSKFMPDDTVSALKSVPGRWALIGQGMSPATRQNLARAFPDFEFAMRNSRGARELYARYRAETD